MAPLSGAAAASRCALQRPSSLRQAGAPPLRPARRQQRPARRPSAAPAPESSVTGTAEAQPSLLSEAEKFVLGMAEAEEAAAAPPPAAGQPAQLQGQLAALRGQVAELSAKIDALYSTVLVGVALPPPAEGDEKGAAASAALAAELAAGLPDPATLTEARFGELGRSSPKVGAAAAVEGHLHVHPSCFPSPLLVLCACPAALLRSCCSSCNAARGCCLCHQPPCLYPAQLVAALLQAKERGDPQGWLAFQVGRCRDALLLSILPPAALPAACSAIMAWDCPAAHRSLMRLGR